MKTCTFISFCFLYGIYAAATEGISKAWISNISRKEETATAIGTYTALQSICTMVASSLAGFLWLKFGVTVIFMSSAIVALLVFIYILWGIKYYKPSAISSQPSEEISNNGRGE